MAMEGRAHSPRSAITNSNGYKLKIDCWWHLYDDIWGFIIHDGHFSDK